MKNIFDFNPSVKMFVVFFYVTFLILNMNVKFNISVLVISLLFVIMSAKRLKLLLSLFVAVIVFSFTIFLMNFLFFAAGKTPYSIVFLHGTYEGAVRGGILAMRAASVIFLSVGYLFSTEPFYMVQSFMQNLRLSEKIGYALLIAFREIYLFKNSLVNIERAMLIRKSGKPIELRDRLKMMLPLFAMVVRKGERSAIALEMRGMILKRKGSYYRDMSLKTKDVLFLIISIGLCILGASLDI